MSHPLNKTEPLLVQGLEELISDCEKCFALCCTALPFAKSSDFAFDKHAGEPCHNIQADFRCGIHPALREQGFRGCTVFDCFGAGQKVSQITFAGQDWRHNPEIASAMYNSLSVMRQLHELLWYLREAISHAAPLHEKLNDAYELTHRLTYLSVHELLNLDMASHRARVNGLLLETSELVRDEARRRHQGPPVQHPKKAGRGADLIGARLKGSDLRYANLRGAYFIAADLQDADLRFADLIGADFRDTNLKGADLTHTLFLTQAQLNAALGSSSTKLPPALAYPDHWL